MPVENIMILICSKNLNFLFLLVLKSLSILGYQGILNFYPNSNLPHKKTKFHKLSLSQKTEDRFISKHRIFIENIFASIKIFKIFSDIYRSRTKRFSLRFNLIASILNFELNL